MALKDILVRPLEDEDMVEVSDWFKDKKWRVPPRENALSNTAFVATLKGRLLSVAWLYVTNSGIGILDWVATNPKTNEKGIISLKHIVDYIEEESDDKLNTILHFTHNDKLASYFNKKCGFKGDGKVNVSIKFLKEN